MAYETTNPPICMIPRIGSGPAIWVYKDGDAPGTVVGASYFSNGDALGMKVGDVLIDIDTGTPGVSVHYVSAVTAGGAATVVADVTA